MSKQPGERTLTVPAPRNPAGDVDAAALQRIGSDALVKAPDRLVLDLRGVDETPEVSGVVAALAARARRQHCALTVQRG